MTAGNAVNTMFVEIYRFMIMNFCGLSWKKWICMTYLYNKNVSYKTLDLLKKKFSF